MLEVVTAAATHDLTTLAAVQIELGTLTNAQKTWAGRAITFASALIEQEANMVFPQQDYQETIPGSGSSTLMLDRTPVIGAPTILSTNNEVIVDFVVEDREAGLLYRRLGWTEEVSYLSNITRDPLAFDRHPNFIVTYTAGFHLPSFPDAIDLTEGQVALPANYEQACILTVKSWFHKKSRDSSVSWKQVGDLALGYRGDSTKGEVMLGLPAEARGLIKTRIF
jgi:hypothetical protein